MGPLRRQGEAARQSMKERLADVSLEHAHLLRDRALGHPQLVGRGAETEPAARNLECAECIERWQPRARVHGQPVAYLHHRQQTSDAKP